MNYKRISNQMTLIFVICLVLILLLIVYDGSIKLIDRALDTLVMMVSVIGAFLVYFKTQRERERQRLIHETDVMYVSLKELEKNDRWCDEFIAQGTQPSIKFYNLTDFGIKRSLNTLRFYDEPEFLETYYMTLKLINIVNNIISASVSIGPHFNANLVSMSKECLCESGKLKVFLRNRVLLNKQKIKGI